MFSGMSMSEKREKLRDLAVKRLTTNKRSFRRKNEGPSEVEKGENPTNGNMKKKILTVRMHKKFFRYSKQKKLFNQIDNITPNESGSGSKHKKQRVALDLAGVSCSNRESANESSHISAAVFSLDLVQC